VTNRKNLFHGKVFEVACFWGRQKEFLVFDSVQIAKDGTLFAKKRQH